MKKSEECKNTPLPDLQLFSATNVVFLVLAVSPSILRTSIHLAKKGVLKLQDSKNDLFWSDIMDSKEKTNFPLIMRISRY